MARRKQSEINAENLGVFKTRAADIINMGRTFKSTHDTILTNLRTRVYEDKAFQRMPEYYKGIVHGYVDAKLDAIWHNEITFQHFLKDTEQYVDAYAFQGPYTDEQGNLRLDEAKNRYVWNGTEQVYYTRKEDNN